MVIRWARFEGQSGQNQIAISETWRAPVGRVAAFSSGAERVNGCACPSGVSRRNLESPFGDAAATLRCWPPTAAGRNCCAALTRGAAQGTSATVDGPGSPLAAARQRVQTGGVDDAQHEVGEVLA
jgi:hypothetical protein